MNGTDFRLFYEQFGIYKLAEHYKVSPNSFVHVSKSQPTSPYDVLHKEKKIRFDIKISSPVKVSSKKRVFTWDFNLRKVTQGKRKGQDGVYCDYFLLVGMKNAVPDKIYLIPCAEAPTNHIRIPLSGNSKYTFYLI